jgi:hypothetical protein
VKRTSISCHKHIPSRLKHSAGPETGRATTVRLHPPTQPNAAAWTPKAQDAVSARPGSYSRSRRLSRAVQKDGINDRDQPDPTLQSLKRR